MEGPVGNAKRQVDDIRLQADRFNRPRHGFPAGGQAFVKRIGQADSDVRSYAHYTLAIHVRADQRGDGQAVIEVEIGAPAGAALAAQPFGRGEIHNTHRDTCSAPDPHGERRAPANGGHPVIDVITAAERHQPVIEVEEERGPPLGRHVRQRVAI